MRERDRDREREFICLKADEGTVCHLLKSRIKLLMQDLEKPQRAPKEKEKKNLLKKISWNILLDTKKMVMKTFVYCISHLSFNSIQLYFSVFV